MQIRPYQPCQCCQTQLNLLKETGDLEGDERPKGHSALKHLSEGSEKRNIGGKLIDDIWYYKESDGEYRNILRRTPAEQNEYQRRQEEERDRI